VGADDGRPAAGTAADRRPRRLADRRARLVDPARTTSDERVLDSYDDVLGDPEVEVVYNPLANGLHGPWNLAAALATMELIDACYRAAGFQPRPRTQLFGS
jgi:predicted dehydrogenase